jgi:transitional endoplasmic reticulum ATPase
MTENTGGTVIVAATNLPWEIDPAMLRPGRFDQKIYVTLPSSLDRLEIIKDQLNKGYYSRDVDASLIAHRTEGFSFADLIYLFKRATQQAFFQSVEKGTKEHIKMDDILNQISLVKRVYSLDLIRKYELFNNQS